jgi:SPP1 family predicted phage head-tail adaptor
MIPKQQIRIENWIAPKDSKGNPKEQIEFARTFWADVKQRSGNRNDSNGQTKLNKSMEFKVRFRPDWTLKGSWKVIYNKKRYSITSIERIQEKRFNWLINGEG